LLREWFLLTGPSEIVEEGLPCTLYASMST